MDDTGVAAYFKYMRQHLNNSFTSAFRVFGAEGTNQRGDCLKPTKGSYNVGEEFIFLDFLICTGTMVIEWPYQKQIALFN